MSPQTIAYVVILGFTAVASGFFSGSETALIALGRERVHQLSATDRRAQRVQQLVSDPDRLLSTVLVANNLVNILGAAVATTLFISMLGEQWGPWASTAAVTGVVLVVGEITPKSLANRYPEKFSLAVAPTVWQLSRVLGPVARSFAWITRGLFRLLRIPAETQMTAVTEEDIRALAELSLAGGEIHVAEHEIIDALFHLADRPIRDIMTPRVDVVALTLPVDIEDVRLAVAATGHSRFPVTDDQIDNLRGVLYVKDVFRQRPDLTPEDIATLIRQPYFLPESTSILSALQQLRARRLTFAVVLDEHGGIEGLITDKDLVAELVGEIHDEYDPGAPTVVKVGPHQWIADGRLPLEDLEQAIGADLPDGPYATAGGLFLALAGRIPAEGEAVQTDGYLLTVLAMDRRRIERLRVEAAG
jgi:CBS domain containing-hemolysin-like protein